MRRHLVWLIANVECYTVATTRQSYGRINSRLALKSFPQYLHYISVKKSHIGEKLSDRWLAILSSSVI